MKPLTGKEMCRLPGAGRLAVAARARLSMPVHGNEKLKVGLQAHLLKLAGIEDQGS